MSKVKIIIEPDDDMTFGELEVVKQAVADFVCINGRHIMSEDGTIVITGVLMKSMDDVDSKAH